MRAYLLSLSLLAAVAFSLGTAIEPWFQTWQGNRTGSANVLQVALGDGRRLFSNHFFLKADAYFHNGYYPSIFDRLSKVGESAHMAEAVRGEGGVEHGMDFLGKPHDWIDRFGRNFYPTRHSHLGADGHADGDVQEAGQDDHDDHKDHGHVHGEHCNHDHGHAAQATAPVGGEQELLPWLRLAAELDPERVQTYVVASYWLRTKLGKDMEAERFLRDGLQVNPGNPEILLELGRLYLEDRKDPVRARNLLELALKGLRQRPADDEDVRFLYGQTLNLLAFLERELKNPVRALEHYQALLEFTPNQKAILEWIDWLKTNGVPATAGAPLQ